MFSSRVRTAAIIVSLGFTVALSVASPAVASQTDPSSPSTYDQAEVDAALIASAQGTLVEGTHIDSTPTAEASPTVSGYGEYVTSITDDLGQGNVRMAGNAVGLPNPSNNSYTVSAYIIVDGAVEDGPPPSPIVNRTSGQLQTVTKCFIQGEVISYVVGLLKGSDIIDKATSGVTVS